MNNGNLVRLVLHENWIIYQNVPNMCHETGIVKLDCIYMEIMNGGHWNECGKHSSMRIRNNWGEFHDLDMLT